MSSLQLFEHVILGGGIIGLSIASQLSKLGPTLLLERRPKLLQETSTHNSGVIHSGLYYPKDSLKTKLCIEGNKWMWENSSSLKNDNTKIEAKKCGKWLVATSHEEVAKLHALKNALDDRGMPSRWISQNERSSLEPELQCVECLESQNTGIVDVHSLANFFEVQFISENDGVMLLNTEVKSMRMNDKNSSLQLFLNDQMQSVIETKCVVNSTGLFASKVAQQFRSAVFSFSSSIHHDLPPRMMQKLCRGTYATLSGKQLLRRLVYPCPLENLSGLGVHSVIDFASSSLLFGPNVEFLSEDESTQILSPACDSSRYATSLSSSSKTAQEEKETEEIFLDGVHEAVKKYLPNIERAKLRRAYCGIRPKLSGKGEGFRDFMIEIDQEILSETKGSLTIVNCLGIESPGLTASPAIGRYVVEEVLMKR